MLTIKINWDKLSDKYNRMNAQSNQNEGKESEKLLYVRQIKGMCYNCGKYGHQNRDCTEKIKQELYVLQKRCHIFEECYRKNKYGQ